MELELKIHVPDNLVIDARMAAARAAKAKFRAATMPPGLAATEAARDETAAKTNEVTVTITL